MLYGRSAHVDCGDGLHEVNIEILQWTLIALRGRALVPEGVCRHRSDEEAGEWMMRRMART